MNNMTSESEDRMVSKDCADSPSVEEVGDGNLAGGGPLKKGPWTSAEDAILVDYVNKHGEGNWNAVQKHSGLSRCGKSCRLRWANHLRPDLKKGAFTPEEERHIIELHAKMGNKWARMAAELPGRTDNEIKNYWNTRIKRRQRAGLSIYPPDICLQALNENQQTRNMDLFPSADTHHPDLLPTNNFEIPAVEFKNLELNQQFYSSALLDNPASSLLTQGLGCSYSNNFMFSTMHPPKRLRESESLLPGVNDTLCNAVPAFGQYQDDGCEKVAQSIGFSSVYDYNLNVSQPSSSCVLPGSHAFLNGNSSSSESISWAMKLELPSLQYSDTQAGSWGTPSSPLPSIESVDTLIRSPATEQIERDYCLSPRNSGLLDAVLYEARTLKNSKNNSCGTSDASVMPGGVDGSSHNLWEAKWEVSHDPISPLGHSAASVFSEYTPISGSSSDEPQSVESMQGCKVKQEAFDWVTARYDGNEDNANQMISTRPDFLLGSNFFCNSTERGKEHSMLTDAIEALLGEDFSSDCKQTGAVSASSGEGCSHGSCAWDAMLSNI
ncbi:hypothetical protein F0562_022534 [Nyssa sinensis]|uniref:Transcription factor n=1 Tax=Nyssa sinensis TaxID=561372 RepID=A0A5J5BS28_9ASTE|nr:hypothetical protein F0562_022534 [Nyssa sinensis]